MPSLGLGLGIQFRNRTGAGGGGPSVASLEFHTQPDGAAIDTPFTQQPVVRALDGEGAVVTSFTGNVTVSIASGGTKEVTTFTGFKASADLAASGAGDGIVISNDEERICLYFDLGTNIAPDIEGVDEYYPMPVGPTDTPLQNAGTMATALATFYGFAADFDGVTPDITVTDGEVGTRIAAENAGACDDDPTIDTPGAGTLSGTLTKAAVAGVATFTDLQLDTEDTYTLLATGGGKTVESDAFTVAGVGFNPADAPLESWIDPDAVTLSGSDITQATDASGKGRNMTPPDAGTQCPAQVTNQLNSHAAIQFTSPQMLSATFSLAQPFTVFTAGRWNADDSFATLMDGQGVNTTVIRRNSGGALEAYAGADLASGHVDLSTWALITVLFDGANSMVLVNGIPVNTGDLGANGFTELHLGAATSAGGFPMGGAAGTGLLGQHIIATGRVPVAKRQMFEGWLARRLALTTLVDRASQPYGEAAPKLFHAVGNSQQVGFNGTIDDPPNSIPVKLRESVGTANYCSFFNRAIDGQYLDQMITAFDDQVKPYYEPGALFIVSLIEGQNQLHLTADTAADIYAKYVTYAGLVHALGSNARLLLYSVVNYGADDTRRNALNALTDADSSFADGYVAWHLDSRLEVITDNPNRAGAHLTASGNDVAVELTVPVLEAIV